MQIYILLTVLTVLSIINLILQRHYFSRIENQMRCRMNILKEEIRYKHSTIREQMLETLVETLANEICKKKPMKSSKRVLNETKQDIDKFYDSIEETKPNLEDYPSDKPLPEENAIALWEYLSDRYDYEGNESPEEFVKRLGYDPRLFDNIRQKEAE